MYLKQTEESFVARAQSFPSHQLASSPDPNTKQVIYLVNVILTEQGVRCNSYTHLVVACA